MRIDKLGELIQNICHLVATLAAADVDDYIRLSPLCKLMLSDGLAASERAGYRRDAALSYREQRIDDALTGDERNIRRKLLFKRSAAAHGPLLHERYGQLIAVCGLYRAYLLGYGVIALSYRFDSTDNAGLHHYSVFDYLGLLHGAEDIAADDLVARFHFRHKMPLLLPVESGHLNASDEAVADELAYLFERALNAVENALDKSGAELDAQRLAR